MAPLFLICRWLCIAGLALTLSGCTRLIFHPMAEHVLTPDKVGLQYQDVYFTASDGLRLHGWWLPAQQARGSILYLHGNGQNISTHLGNVFWLPAAGYNVLLIDYRGYGLSQGIVDLPGALRDIDDAIAETFKLAPPELPVFIVGQSLGSSLSVYTLSQSIHKLRLRGAIFISPFSDYRRITREVLSRVWFTWPLQYPLSWTINNDYAPDKYIARIAPLPVVLMHGYEDDIIAYQHSEALYRLAKEPKQLLLVHGDHNTLMVSQENRQTLLKALDDLASPAASQR